MREKREITWEEDVYERRPVTSTPECPATGTMSVRVGRRVMKATVIVELDVDATAKRLGRKAATNKTRKTAEASGLLKVTCLSVWEESKRPAG